MGRRIAALIIMLSATMLLAWAPPAPLAATSGGIPPILHRLTTPLPAPPGTAIGGQRVTAMVELVGPPAISAGTATKVGLRSQQLAVAQLALIQRLIALHIQVLFQTRLSYNGIAVSLPADQLQELRGLPGIADVHVIPPKQRANAAVVPFIGAPAVWSAPGGVTGRGIRIGIIDSGIDYTHADFGGPGTPQSYTANDRTRIEPGSFPTAKVVGGYDFAGDNYDASGVAGSPIPTPDPDPLDCNGHGTHVAGTAAGFGVADDGTTYPGPYTDGLDFTHFRVGPGVAPEAQLYALKVFGCQGSTTLMALAIERALDPNGDGNPADHLDVINISLSSAFGSDDDPDSIALDNAVRAGVVAVVAVGDTGNTFYATGAPASAQLAIAVGASIDTARASTGAPADSLASFSSRGPQRGNSALKPDLVAPGLDLRSASVGSGTAAVAMSGTSTAAPQVAGAAALLRQLHHDWTPEQIKAALMNTAAPVRMADGKPYPPSLGGAGRLDMTNLAGLDLLAYAGDMSDTVALTYGAPWIAHPATATRQLLLDNQSSVARNVSLSATTTVTEAGVTIQLPPGPISIPAHAQVQVPVAISVDPQALDFTPDAATPLEQDANLRYFMAEHGGYVQVATVGGMRVRPVNAAAVGTVAIYLDGQVLDPSIDPGRVGQYQPTTLGTHTVIVKHSVSGRLVLLSAQVQFLKDHDYSVIVVGRDNALGVVVVDETPAALPAPNQALLHVVNANLALVGPLDVYLDGALYAPALPAGQATSYSPVALGSHIVRFFRAGMTPPHASPLATITFTANDGELLLIGAGQHGNSGDCSLDSIAHDEPDRCKLRAFFGSDIPGPTTGSSVLARVPFQIFPKSASDAHVVAGSATIRPDGHAFSVNLHNTGARNAGLTQSFAGPQVPLASAFELEATSPPITGLSGNLRAADIQYVGVTNSLSTTGTITGTLISFGVASYRPWFTPNEVEFLVYIDSNRDGIDDYVLVNTNLGVFLNTSSDVFLSPIYKIMPDGSWVADNSFDWDSLQPSTGFLGFDAAPFNTSVMFQAVTAELIGLSPSQTRFRYHLETRARDAGRFGQVVDRVPAVGALEYDLAHPAIAPINTTVPILAPRPVFLDVDGGQIAGAVDPVVLSARGSQKLLVLHLHNPPGTQTDVVEISSALLPRGTAPPVYRTFLPLMSVPR
jgi:subtilisin family serine protease